MFLFFVKTSSRWITFCKNQFVIRLMDIIYNLTGEKETSEANVDSPMGFYMNKHSHSGFIESIAHIELRQKDDRRERKYGETKSGPEKFGRSNVCHSVSCRRVKNVFANEYSRIPIDKMRWWGVDHLPAEWSVTRLTTVPRGSGFCAQPVRENPLSIFFPGTLHLIITEEKWSATKYTVGIMVKYKCPCPSSHPQELWLIQILYHYNFVGVI